MNEDTAGSQVMRGSYCGHCGESATGGEHSACTAALALEPPRYCATCRRRMTVQVLPSGWTARCVEHGGLTGSTWAGR